MKATITFLALIFSCIFCMSQSINLSGHWTGKLSQNDKSYDFGMEVNLLQQGNILSGTSKYVAGDGNNKYAIYNISGRITGNQITLLDLDIIEENSDGGGWYWCKKVGTAKIAREGDSLIVSGYWKSDNNQAYFGKELRGGYGCAPGFFKLSRYSPLRKVTQPRLSSKSVVKGTPKALLSANTTAQKTPQKQSSVQSQAKRSTQLKAIIEVESEEISLEFYDDLQVDGDTITVYFDNKVLIFQKPLSFSPLTCSIRIQRNKDHELIMFADNQGTFGENTAKLIIYDSKGKREINMHSNMKVSQSLLFRRKELEAGMNH